MYKINQVKLNINHNEADFKSKIAKTVGVSVGDIKWSTLIILHKAIDARDKKNILFVYNVAFDFVGSDTICPSTKLEKYEPIVFNPIIGGSHSSPIQEEGSHSSPIQEEGSQRSLARPVVVGFGPAGIFASYILALNGLKPIIIERGKALEDRIKDVDKFFNTMELNEESNVCFGEGGAGAFSDGKLNTNNKDKTGVYRFVLETFVKFGADEKILYENLPHIGTDKLANVIKKIRDEIIRLGGEIHYSTKFCFRDGLASFAPTASFALADAPIILAIGNSSRDTFRELIENGFDVKAKPIAVGYRVAHRQSLINKAQYGEKMECDHANLLGPATYKLTYDVGNGHSVYSFCMCPGGYIINSSNKKGQLAINGMSYNDRGGEYANSAIVETVNPSDVESVVSAEALKMIEFQERVEKMAFELEKGYVPYVSSGGSDICTEDLFKGQAKYCEKLKTVYENCGLKLDINKDIEMALKHFNKIIPGFFCEGSQSSPIRNEGSQSSPIRDEGSQSSPIRDKGSQSLPVRDKGSQSSPIRDEGSQSSPIRGAEYIIAGVETRTSSPIKLDRDENYMCNVPNYYPCGEGLGHGGGIMSCAADGVNVAYKIAKKLKNRHNI